MHIGERIKDIRKKNQLNQKEFGERIGITYSSISLIEKGTNNPSEQTIRAICQEFNIRRQWLEEGIGDMFVPEAEDDQIIEEAFAQRSEFVKALFKAITKTPGGWELMEQLAENIAKELQTKKDPVE